MLYEEAKWIGKRLCKLETVDISPLCNIGSSTEEYRHVLQSYIDAKIFAPLRNHDVAIFHVDIKPQPGVDLVGDLADRNFLTQLTERRFKSVMCCNLLEHVVDRSAICNALMSMVEPHGYLVVTVPNRFPYHEDPIDTMFRPSLTELVSLFPGTSVIEGKTVSASRIRYDYRNDWAPLFWLFVRCCIPFYRPQSWLAAVRSAFKLLLDYRVTCVILKKD
jgi:hypothetical protein